MALRAPRSSGSTDSTADSIALLLLSANTAGATDVMLGDWLICLLISAIVWACAAADASRGGDGPRPRISWDERSGRRRLLPTTIDSPGGATASSPAAAVTAEAHGRRITPPI